MPDFNSFSILISLDEMFPLSKIKSPKISKALTEMIVLSADIVKLPKDGLGYILISSS